MRRRKFGAKLSIRFLFLVLLIAPIGAFAQLSVQSPECGGVIQGVVSDSAGRAVRGIEVEVWPLGVALGYVLPTVRTDDAGRYRFEELCPGRYTVLVDDEERGYPYIDPWLFELLYGRRVPKVRLTPKHLSAELPLQVPAKPGRILLRVMNRKTNTDVPKFTAELIVPGQHHMPKVEFDCDPKVSNCNIPVPPDKDFVLRITAEGFEEWSDGANGHQLIHVRAGEQITLEAQLQPLG